MNKLLLAACCALCACTADKTQQGVSEVLTTRTIRLTAAPQTRTELAPDGFSVLWSPGDTIGVYVKSGPAFTTLNVPMVFEGTTSASTGTFAGEITLSQGASEYTLYAYYPYAAQASPDASKVPFTLRSQQVQEAGGSSLHLGDCDFLAAGAVQSTTADFPPLAFRHAFAVVELDLTASGVMSGKQLAGISLYTTDAASVDASGNLNGASNMSGVFEFDLTSGAANNTAVYQGGSAQVDYCSLTFTTPPTLGATAVKAYVTINPADYSIGGGRVYFTIRTTDGYLATYSRPGLVIGAAQMKVIRQAVTTATAPQPAVDLSGSGQRANCYIASVAGQAYMFDATVAGNGFISQGLSAAVQQFEGRTLSSALSGTTARLLWQSNPRLIDAGSVNYDGGNIYFTLTDRPTVLGGNAVIGLYASSDPEAEALWSWHIWITDQDNVALISQAQTYILFSDYEQEYGPGSVQMMDRNLGAVYKEDGPYARSFRAPLYQWGRKDPMPWGKVVFDAQDAPQNYIALRPPVLCTGSPGQYVGYTGNTYYVTAHPDVFIATQNTSSFDWYYGGGAGNGPSLRNNELWGNPTGYEVGQKTTKSLFDPCPPGWVMPHPYAFSGFTKSGDSAAANDIDSNVTGAFVQGWNFYYSTTEMTYYPGVGFRYDEFGLFAFTPSGYYWSSAPAPDTTFGAWVFGLTSAQILQRLSDPRGFGFPVRCMRDLPTP